MDFILVIRVYENTSATHDTLDAWHYSAKMLLMKVIFIKRCRQVVVTHMPAHLALCISKHYKLSTRQSFVLQGLEIEQLYFTSQAIEETSVYDPIFTLR